MPKANKWIFIFMPFVLFLSGCWDFQLLKDRVLITGISVDKHHGGYGIGLEIIQFASGGGEQTQGGTPTTLMTTYPRRSIEQPLHLIMKRLSGEAFYPNISILVFSKEMAKEGIANAISHFTRDPDMRRNTVVVISEKQAYDLLKIRTKNELFTSLYLSDMTKVTQESGWTVESDIGDISRAIHEKGVALVPLLIPSTDGKEAKLIGTVVLQSGKYVDQLSIEESRPVALLGGKTKRASLINKCPSGNGVVSLDIVNAKPSMKPSIKKGKLSIQGNVKLVGYISEFTCADENLEKITSIETVEKEFNRMLTKEMKGHITSILHRTGVDVLELRKQLERDPKQWKEIEADFPKLLRDAEVDLKVEVEVKLKGAAN